MSLRRYLVWRNVARMFKLVKQKHKTDMDTKNVYRMNSTLNGQI